MTFTAFRRELHAQPFSAFLVKTTDGDTFIVRHPDHALITDEDDVVRIYDPDGHYRVIAMAHIVSLEPVRDQARKPGKR
jgi:hypothetical protein